MTDPTETARAVLEAAEKATANPGASPLRPSVEVLRAERLNQEHAPALAQYALDASAEIERLKAELVRQIAWTPGEPPREDGKVFYGHQWQPYRWKPYSGKSEQWARGIRGRWQRMHAYAGWENAPPPNEWATEEQIQARTALNQEPKSPEGEG